MRCRERQRHARPIGPPAPARLPLLTLAGAGSGKTATLSARVAWLIGVGVVVGTGISLWASRFVAALLYGLEPRDPATLLAAGAVLAAVGAMAGWLPAYRASRIDPAAVLRDS